MNHDNTLTKRLLAEGYTKDQHPDYVNWHYDGFEYTARYLERLIFVVQCACHKTERPYAYDSSLDKIWDIRRNMEARKFWEFAVQKKGRVCRVHMRYRELSQKWELDYNPISCAGHGVRGCTGFCPLRNCELSEKRGNVFYDVKITRIIHDGSLFDGQPEVAIVKGRKFLEYPVSLSICEEIAKRCAGEITWRENMKSHNTLFFHPDTKIDVFNIRAERRESRDLIQDLQDVRDGIVVTHESDAKKAAKEAMRERRKQNAAKRIKRIKAKAKANGGISSLTKYELRRLSCEDIAEIKAHRPYEQLTFDDLQTLV